MQFAKRKMKLLATKLAALQSEVSVSREILKTASHEIEKHYQEKYSSKENIDEVDNEIKEYKQEEKPNNKPAERENISSAEKDADEEVRKAFKKIASQCHPDKLQDLEDGFEKRKKQEFYQRARQALENNDMVSMSDIAEDLGVDVPEITAAQIKEAERKIVSIKKELSMIESTAIWFWFFTEEKPKKEKILEELLHAIYQQRNPGA